MAFRTLLYRYFFFDWLFRDVSRGSLFERAAAWRHNQSQAHWLLTYLKRWCVTGGVLYLAGNFVELALGAPAWSSVLYMPVALSVPISATIAVAWAGLKALPGPTP